MKFLGILRASALCLIVSAFHSQHVSCGIFKSTEKSKENSNAKVSEILKESTAESQVIENPSHDPSTLKVSESSKSLDEVLKQIEQEREAKGEELLKRISEQRKELVESLLESDAPFSLEDMVLFLGILRTNADVNPEALQKVGEKVHAYLGSLGIHGDDAKSSLEILMERISKYRSAVKTLIYRPHEQPSPEELIVAGETYEILKQLPKSHVNTHANDHDCTEDSSDELPVVDVPKISENHKESTEKPSHEPSSKPSAPASKSNLVFESSSWDDSQLLSAVLSLEEFCRGVNAKKFSGSPFDELYEGMKGPCLRVSYYARSYTDHFRPRNLHDNTYKDALKPEMFKYYVGWLKKNIPGIIGSLEHLFNEFKGLSEKQLINDASFVPVMYGFEFHDAWSDKDFKSNLRHKTYNLINALKYLYGHF